MGQRASKVKTERFSLTRGERLHLWRRRENIDQRTAARRLGVTLAVYGQLERDQLETTQRLSKAVNVALGALQMHEKCFLARRRAGKTQVAVAEDLKRCRWWVNQMEHGKVPCDELAWYWFQ